MKRTIRPSLSLISLRTAFRRSSNSAVLRPGDQRPQVQRHDALLLEGLGHVAADDPLGQPLDDRGLADAGLADQDGVVLRPAAQDLDDAPDLLVAPDHGVQLPGSCFLGQVAAVLLECLVGALRGCGGDPLATADAREGAQDGLAPRRVSLEERLAFAPGVDHAQEQVLRGDELIRQPARLLGRALQHAAGARVERQLAAGDLRAAREEGGELAAERPQVHPEPAERLGRDSLVGLDESGKDVLRVEDRALEPLGERLRSGDRLLGLLGETVEVHGAVGSFRSGSVGSAASSADRGFIRRASGRAGPPRPGRRRRPAVPPRRARAGSLGP